MSRVAPFPPCPLNYFRIEPGQDPEPGDFIALGGFWWPVVAVDGPAVVLEGGTRRVLQPGEEFPIARVCCRSDTRYAHL